MCQTLFEAPRIWYLNASFSVGRMPLTTVKGVRFSVTWEDAKSCMLSFWSCISRKEKILLQMCNKRLLQWNTRQGFMEHSLDKSCSFGATLLITHRDLAISSQNKETYFWWILVPLPPSSILLISKIHSVEVSEQDNIRGFQNRKSNSRVVGRY